MGNLDMGNRYADDIKRIVGIDPNQNVLGAAKKKAAIPGRRGIGYYNPKTGGSTGTSGTPNQTQLENVNSADLDTGENQAGENGLDPNNPQNGIMEETTGQRAVEEIIDGTAPESKISDPQITDAGLEYSNNGALNSILAEDCDTGDAIDIRTRGEFLPPQQVVDSEGNIISEAWTDADTPPDRAGFVLGQHWTIIGLGGSGAENEREGSTPSEAIERFLSALNAQGGPSTPYTFSHYTFDDPNYTVYYDRNPDVGGDANFPMSQQSCSSFPPEDPNACPASAPKETQWPADQKYVMRLNNGKFETNQYDSEVPANRKNPQSLIDFCFGEGRTGAVEVTKDNGFMLYETDNGAPTGIIRAYDSAGQMIAAFDGTAGWIDNYRVPTTP